MRKRIERTPPTRGERPKPPVHTGHLVWRYLIDTKQNRNLLAKETNRSLITVSRQLRKPSMQVAELFEFCMVLKHNFFHTLGQRLPPEFTGHPDNTQAMQQLQTENEQLKTEIARLKTENEKLNDRVDLLLRKL